MKADIFSSRTVEKKTVDVDCRAVRLLFCKKSNVGAQSCLSFSVWSVSQREADSNKETKIGSAATHALATIERGQQKR